MTSYPTTAYPSTSMQAPTVASGNSNITYTEQQAVPMYLQTKKGGTCCGFCCDFRRATIMVNSIIISLSAFSVASLLTRPDTEEIIQEYQEIAIDDDQVLEELASIADTTFVAGAVLAGVLLVFTAVPLYGAYVFNAGMVAFGVVLLVASFIAETLLTYIYIEKADDVVEPTGAYEFNQPIFIYTLSAIVQALFIYPHVGLILEIRAGIMSFETYPREAYSCCCGENRMALQQAQVTQSTVAPSEPSPGQMNANPNYYPAASAAQTNHWA